MFVVGRSRRISGILGLFVLLNAEKKKTAKEGNLGDATTEMLDARLLSESCARRSTSRCWLRISSPLDVDITATKRSGSGSLQAGLGFSWRLARPLCLALLGALRAADCLGDSAIQAVQRYSSFQGSLLLHKFEEDSLRSRPRHHDAVQDSLREISQPFTRDSHASILSRYLAFSISRS